MTDSEDFADYYRQVQCLTVEDDPVLNSDELLDLINRRIQEVSGEDQQFFLGEQAFFEGKYKSALNHYMKANSVPMCRFFCYRTTASILEHQGARSKAIKYAKKALKIQPDDCITLKLLTKLLRESGRPVEAKRISEHLESLKDLFDGCDTGMPAVSIGSNELNELTSFFESAAPAAASSTEEPDQNLSPTIMEPVMETDQNPQGTEELSSSSTTTMTQNSSDAVEQLGQLAQSCDFTVEKSSTDQFMNTMGLGDSTSDDTLQTRIDNFGRHLRELIAEYIQQAKTRSQISDDALYVLSGWENQAENSTTGLQLLDETCRQSSGGFFVNFNGFGVAINPGRNFLRNLHSQGLFVTDIDCVVVTRCNADTCSDLQAIYDLNYQINLNNTDSDLHIINYYLNQQTHRDFSSKLKPNFKQERNTIHSLELYVDSPDVEKVKLSDDVSLNYFLTAASDAASAATSLGVRLDFADSENGRATTIGYLSGAAWSPMLAQNLGSCDTLICGFEGTNSKDFRKVKHNENSLGYFGTFSLMEEVAPRVLLACEFNGREGDVRLEAVKKMRREYAYSNSQGTAILPGDAGLVLDLKTMNVRCSISNSPVDPSQVHVTKSTSAFGRLQYLSPSCFV